MSHLFAAAYLGFYELAAAGTALTDESSVKDWFGASVRENYPEAGPAFLRFATTYWTLKVLIRQLRLENSHALVHAFLRRVDDLLGELFFPSEGPIKIDPARREADQRRFLAAFGPKIDIEDFIQRNPILIRDRRTSKRPWWRR